MFSAKLINPKTEIELKAKPGMYFYQIKNDNGIIENSKIVIQ
ncbi:MAG: T9SS type A sorting domain-containing protein [Bacteroidetes bacterium]|nr:T9SS type A sorting domain-containing protein [Bacteroidota bacterium]